MKLIDGKFYNDKGEEIFLEFGNKEQINLMRIQQGKIDALNGEGLEPEIQEVINVEVRFVCPKCITRIFFGDVEYKEEYLPDELIKDFSGNKKTCKCGAKYILDKDEYGDLVVKFLK